jgi:hypothetical protein
MTMKPKPSVVICAQYQYNHLQAVRVQLVSSGGTQRTRVDSRDWAFASVSTLHSASQGEYSRHPHGEAFDDDMRVEGLEDILRDQTVVNALVLVLFELRELVLPYVHHFCAVYRVWAGDV